MAGAGVGELSPRIVVLGVGGAGGNAVDNMIASELRGVEFIVANTDAQALSRSNAGTTIQLGPDTTKGLGAGARPEVGAAAAEESVEAIRKHLEGANMVFIAAGMGGGTGTGAAPIIARISREVGALTVGVVTKPFSFEHARRMKIAESGVKEMRDSVDTLIVVPNQNLFRVANERTPFSEAFRMVDDVLYSGVRGITDLMVMPGLINLDFADVRAVMADMGTAMMGIGEAEGEGRALAAARAAIANPLLDDVSMKGAKGVLINITGGYDMTLFELDEAANEIRAEVAGDANVILGSAFDDALEGKLRISVVAAGVGMQDREASAHQALSPSKPTEPKSDFVAPVVVTSYRDEGEEIEATQANEQQDDVQPATALDAQKTDAANDSGAPAAVQPEKIEVEETAMAKSQEQAEEVSKDTSGAQPGFSNLFGWRRSSETKEDASDEQQDEAIVSSPDDHPEPAPFDDADLEIPAFLRRSANH
ncbi:MAG: cell division protein FtsZ [Pseudomonadota bacterium]